MIIYILLFTIISYHSFYRIAYFLELIWVRVDLLAHRYYPLYWLHPSASQFVIQHMGDFRGISPNCYAKHSYSKWPWSIAYWEVDISIVGCDVLPYQAAVHNIVNCFYHFFVSSFFLENIKETFHVFFWLLKSEKAISVFFFELFRTILLI